MLFTYCRKRFTAETQADGSDERPSCSPDPDQIAAQHQLDELLEREERMVNLQFALSDARRENEDLKDNNRRLETENLSLNAMMFVYLLILRSCQNM